MIKKIIYLGVFSTLLASIVSCEKDFTDVGSTIIDNDKFATKKEVFDVEITQKSIDFVKSGGYSEYLLGTYKKNNAKTIEAGFVSQVFVPSNISKYKETSILNGVILKIPVNDTIQGKGGGFKVNVYRNSTYLYSLNPNEVSKEKVYLSNDKYEKGEILNISSISKIDSIFIFNNGKDTLRMLNKKPFIAVELDKTKLKEVIFDRYKVDELSNQEKFNNYFRGIIVETVENEMMVSLNINKLRPSIEFIHRDSKNKKYTDKFYLGGITNSIYKTVETNSSLPNNVVLQGTAGYEGLVKVLNSTDLQKLRSKNIIINDASLVFDVNTSTNLEDLPKQLFLYKDVKDGSKLIRNGIAELQYNADKPNNYTFNIRELITDIIKGKENSNLVLRVLDNDNNTYNRSVNNYSSNPRAVNLLSNSTENGAKRGVKLVISYTEKK